MTSVAFLKVVVSVDTTGMTVNIMGYNNNGNRKIIIKANVLVSNHLSFVPNLNVKHMFRPILFNTNQKLV